MNTDIQTIVDQGFYLMKLQAVSKQPEKGISWVSDAETKRQTRRTASDFKDINVGVRCGMPLSDGGYLAILDVDPRNKGDQTLTILQRANESLPPTFTVETGRGDGGKHYYFRSKKPFPCMLLGKGLDVKGKGGYVVGPGSQHPKTGKKYKIIDDQEIADIPDWFYDVAHTKEDEIVTSKTFFDAVKANPTLAKTYESGSRNSMMAKEAGKLRRSDVSFDVMLEALKVINIKKCKPPLEIKELTAICSSMLRYAPNTGAVITTEEKPPEAKKVNKPKDLEKVFQEIYEESTGLVRLIADEIMASAVRPYPQFAIAASLAVVSACAQGTYLGPGIAGSKNSGQSLNSYFWAVAPSAAGKNSYISAVEKYLAAVDINLLVPNIGSAYGLRNHLYAQNTCISVLDEVEETIAKIAKSQNAYVKDIFTDMKILYNNPKILQGTLVKGKKYPTIHNPNYSMFGMGTVSGFLKQLSGDIIAGGLLSRFDVWPFFNVAARQYAPELIPSKNIVKSLQTLYLKGRTPTGKQQSFVDTFNNYEGKMGADKKMGSAPEHIAQFGKHKTKLLISEAADKMFLSFNDRQERLYMEAVKQNESNDSDFSPGSIHDRAGMKAQKFASMLAIGNMNDGIDLDESAWGIKLAKALADSLVETVEAHGGETFIDKAELKLNRAIDRIMLKNPAGYLFNKRDILRAVRIKSQVIDQLLIDMVIRGDITAIDPMNQVSYLADNKIPRGTKFQLNEVKK